jgi:chromate transporter
MAIFLVFLRLGLTCFGGPIAHLGYFRDEFVTKRQWLDDKAFADLVALCQFLPGPASSQVGFAIGLRRGGLPGALEAWCGFTLPSAIALTFFALGAGHWIGEGALHGLRLVAVAIVAQAVWGMSRSLCPDWQRRCIGLAGLLIMLLSGWQFAVIALGSVAGYFLCRGDTTPADSAFPVPRAGSLIALLLFLLLLAESLIGTNGLAKFDAFYRSGALVFGGGHVVLPLLRQAFVAPGWISDDAFLAGYGAAQAVPGPLFTFAAYLGAATGGIGGAVVGLIGIFLPGILILLAALPYWDALRSRSRAQATIKGVNAAVVGLLATALYTPLWTGSVHRLTDFAIAAAGFLVLVRWKCPPLLVVLLGALAGAYL